MSRTEEQIKNIEIEEIVLLFRDIDDRVTGILNHTSCKECESMHAWELTKTLKHYLYGLIGKERLKTERPHYEV